MPSVSAEVCNRVVAFVNGDVVTLYELNRRIKLATGIEPFQMKTEDNDAYIETRRNALDQLIDEKIAKEKTKELGIEISEKELDETIERIKKQNSLTHEDLLEDLRKEGLTIKKYRQNLRSEIERMRLINREVKSKIIIREENVSDYYDRHKSDFSKAERLRLAAIFLKAKGPSSANGPENMEDKVREILRLLEQGMDFTALAIRFSQGPGAEEGGDLGYFKSSQLDGPLTEVLGRMKPGEVSEPIMRPYGVQIIKLLERESGTVKPFKEVRDAIYSILYKEEVNKRYLAWIKELREKAYIKIIF